MNNIGIIIQARMGSTRLPRKMLLPFFEEKGILALLVDRLLASPLPYPITLATSRHSADDAIANTLSGKIEVFRGSENNVLKRFINCAKSKGYERIIRICADNPFLDIQALQELLTKFEEEPTADYIAYRLKDGRPTIKSHFGFWAEGVSLRALEAVQAQTQEQLYIEHVTNYIYEHPAQFHIHWLDLPDAFPQEMPIRLTLDTAEDFQMQQEIYAAVAPQGVNIPNILKTLAGSSYLETMTNLIHQHAK